MEPLLTQVQVHYLYYR